MRIGVSNWLGDKSVLGVSVSRERHPSGLSCKYLPRLAKRSGSRISAKVNPSESAIDIAGLCHQYGDKKVLKSASLRVAKGSLHLLAGANGCGKSTLLRILGGLLAKQRGDVRIDGTVGMVLQNPDHQIVMPTVAAEVAFGLGRYKLSQSTINSLVENALQSVDLGGYGERTTNSLSGGEKQRVAIAGALVTNPKILLLDELTTFLDDEGQRSVMEAVRKAVDGKSRVTALWVTHRLEELKWADAASFIDEGQVKVSGTPEKVFHHFRALGASM